MRNEKESAIEHIRALKSNLRYRQLRTAIHGNFIVAWLTVASALLVSLEVALLVASVLTALAMPFGYGFTVAPVAVLACLFARWPQIAADAIAVATACKARELVRHRKQRNAECRNGVA